MMIVNIAGTAGAGKSVAVRSFLTMSEARFNETVQTHPTWELGRIYSWSNRPTKLFLVGRYDPWEIGGCDTIKDAGLVYKLIREKAIEGLDVMFEGLAVMNPARGVHLCQEIKNIPVHVFHLTTKRTAARAGVKARQERRAQLGYRTSREIDELMVRAKYFVSRMHGAGAKVHRVTRDEAPVQLMELFR